uniref:Uncharacterized protein n=1 Tax=Leersia perrieri TaxID=77586 RepID=A0A0D9WVT8_9ORYZ
MPPRNPGRHPLLRLPPPRCPLLPPSAGRRRRCIVSSSSRPSPLPLTACGGSSGSRAEARTLTTGEPGRPNPMAPAPFVVDPAARAAATTGGSALLVLQQRRRRQRAVGGRGGRIRQPRTLPRHRPRGCPGEEAPMAHKVIS